MSGERARFAILQQVLHQLTDDRKVDPVDRSAARLLLGTRVPTGVDSGTSPGRPSR